MTRISNSIIDFFDIEAPYVTEFRRLLHRIQKKAENGTELKSIMFTSAMLSEGKSTTGSFLAITAALKKGMKTLVVDADLRRPTIQRLFKIGNKPGLHEILSEGYNVREAINKTSIDKLDVLTTGSRCESPSEVFDADAIGAMIEEMKFYYDYIIVDTPPLLPVSDPMLLSSKMDGVVMVVKAGSTQKDVVRRAVEILDPDTTNVIGVVMNNMSHSLPYYYDYGYYHYEYGSPEKRKKKPPHQQAGRTKKQPPESKSSSGIPSKHK